VSDVDKAGQAWVPASARIQQPPGGDVGGVYVEITDGASTEASRALDKAAQRLYYAYKREMNRVIGEVWRGESKRIPKYDAKHSKPWERMAAQLMAAGISNIEGFVHFQFRFGTSRQPAQLLARDAITKYQESLTEIRVGQRLEWRAACDEFELHAQTLSFATKMTVAQIQRRVLTTTVYGFSPLFCYCVAAKNDHADICQSCHDAALKQLLTDYEGYATNWAKYIPADLLKEAAMTIGASFDEGNRA